MPRSTAAYDAPSGAGSFQIRLLSFARNALTRGWQRLPERILYTPERG